MEMEMEVQQQQHDVDNGVHRLDTVRALHQTVVSLRAALEASKSELNSLRQKYEQTTLPENVAEGGEIDLNEELRLPIEVEASTAAADSRSDNESLATVRENKSHNKKIRFVEEEVNPEADPADSDKKTDNGGGGAGKSGEYETKLELESSFDVTIKLSACQGTGEGDSTKPFDIKSSVDQDFEKAGEEESKMAGSSSENSAGAITKATDRYNISVKITSEENLTLDTNVPQATRRTSERDSTSDHLNVETDEISVRSISEGDNSVFSEAGETLTGNVDRLCEQDSVSGNDSEEVDDIELIFTTDETKEFTSYHQEDLVSITDAENWTADDPSTPVLVKFNVVDPDKRQLSHVSVGTDTGRIDEESESRDRVDTGHIDYKRGFLRSDKKPSSKDSRFAESCDSLTGGENQKSYSFDNTKSSSLDRGSSVDIVSREMSFDQREESMDRLDVLRNTARKKYSVCIETDISKCGVMDDTFPTNINLRRNTCPNPFQYRPMSHRDVVKGNPVRPLLGSSLQKAPRRSSAAQTDISALPEHWRSDTHLSKKVLPHGLTTLPSKISSKGITGSRLTPPAPLRPNRLTEESRRILLSDIGFTSMVPELSRSAEPIWGPLGLPIRSPTTSVTHLPLCCAYHAAPYYGSVPSSPTRQDSSNTNSKYWSRSSIQRSMSEKMGENTPVSQRVSFIDQPMRHNWRGSLPELRKNAACCSRPGHRFRKAGQFGRATRSKTLEGGDSGDSTEELLDEAEFFLKSSLDCTASTRNYRADEFSQINSGRPYLPSAPRQLRLGHIVKVIAPHGRIMLGKVRYVGIAGGPEASGKPPITYIGIQLKNKSTVGGDGSFHGRKYFHCEPGYSVFVPFSKIVVAWSNWADV